MAVFGVRAGVVAIAWLAVVIMASALGHHRQAGTMAGLGLALWVLARAVRRRYLRRSIRAWQSRERSRAAREILCSWSQVAVDCGMAVYGTGAPGEPFEGVDYLYTRLRRTIDHLRRVHRPWPPPLYEMRVTDAGLDLRVRLVHGQTLEDWAKATSRLASRLRVRAVKADAAEPGFVLLRLTTEASNFTRREPSAVPPATLVTQVTVGTDRFGAPWSVKLLGTAGTLVGGIPGSGKSGFLSALLAAVADNERIQVVGIDLKAGLELLPWSARMSCIATSQEDAVEVLTQLKIELGRRNERLRQLGLRRLDENGVSIEMPLLLIIVDEVSDLLQPMSRAKDDRERSDHIERCLSLLVRHGRAAGLCVILATQKPGSDAIPTVIRDACDQRIAFRTTTPEHTKTILGTAAMSFETAPHAFTPDSPGLAVAGYAGSTNLEVVKTTWLSDDEVAVIAQHSAHLRRPFPQIRGLPALP